MAELTLAEMRERLDKAIEWHQPCYLDWLSRNSWILDLASEALARREREALKLNGAWRCSCCGELMEAGDSRWRWNGQAWEHSHGQAGHFEARDFSPVTDGEAG